MGEEVLVEVAIRKLRFVVGCCKLRVAPMGVLKCLRP